MSGLLIACIETVLVLFFVLLLLIISIRLFWFDRRLLLLLFFNLTIRRLDDQFLFVILPL